MANFSERLKELRLKNKLTQKQLANELNVSQTAIALWEKGKRQPDIQTLEQLARLFDVNTDFLLGIGNDLVITVNPETPDRSSEKLMNYCKKYLEELSDDQKVSCSVFINYILKNNYSTSELERLLEYAEFLKSRRGTHKSKKNNPDIVLSPVLNAAHQRTDTDIPSDTDTSDDDIMSNPDE